MSKSKYRFNPESLSYDKVNRTTKDKLFRISKYFSASILLAIVYYVSFSFFFDSPKEKGLKRQVSELRMNYKLLNNQLGQIQTVLDDMKDRDDNIYRTIFEAEPISKSIREAGFGGVDRYRSLEKLNDANIVVNTAKRLDKIAKKIYVQSVSYDEIIKMAVNKEAMLAAVPAIQPISNKDLKRTASGWGYRIHPIYKIRKFHYGMDFTAPTGTEIYATGDGVVKVVNSSQRGYGNKVVIDHGFGYQTLYGHMSAFNVKVGQKVKRGDVIGYVGNTGLSTGPHLHYEVIHNNKKVNPVNYYFNDLTAKEYDEMIEISMNTGQSFD
jgi:murein DD-endopeptidase MepM/ murein hydrolase activator NlpD